MYSANKKNSYKKLVRNDMCNEVCKETYDAINQISYTEYEGEDLYKALKKT